MWRVRPVEKNAENNPRGYVIFALSNTFFAFFEDDDFVEKEKK